MSQQANTHDSYDAVGNREDLADAIYMVSPTKTPLLSMSTRGSADSTKKEWQVDSLAAADDTNAAVEGDEFTNTAITATSRVFNYTQISKKVINVSGTQEAVKKAGRKSEVAREMMKKTKELKRDMEKILTGNQAEVLGDNSTARKLRSLCSWYESNVSRGTGGSSGSAGSAATDGTQRAFTETLFKNVLESIHSSGGDPDVVMLGSKNKQTFSGFTGGATAERSAEEKKITASVDIYESDFSVLRVVPNLFQRGRDCHILQKDMMEVAYLRPFMKKRLADTGDSIRHALLAEYTLVVRNEAACGVVADLTV